MEKEHKFQVGLVIMVWILTIVSSLISGYLIYRLTLDTSPTITVYPYYQNNGTYAFVVSNLENNPAYHITLGYKFKGVDELPRFIGSVPFLDKGMTTVNLDLSDVTKRVIEVAENNFSELASVHGYKPFKVAVGDEFMYNSYAHMFDLSISATCNNCKSNDILIPFATLEFTPDITCQRLNLTNSKNFSCSIGGYSAFAPY